MLGRSVGVGGRSSAAEVRLHMVEQNACEALPRTQRVSRDGPARCARAKREYRIEMMWPVSNLWRRVPTRLPIACAETNCIRRERLVCVPIDQARKYSHHNNPQIKHEGQFWR
jgi:hypothetical protein